MLKLKKFSISTAITTAVATAALSLNHQAQAASFELDNFTVEWDTVMTAGVQFRIEDRNDRISTGSTGRPGDLSLDNLGNVIDNAFIINSNDGNNNFDTGLTSARVSFLTEADINFGNSGVFIRGKFWEDFVYGQSTDMTQTSWESNNANPMFGPNGGYSTGFGEHNPGAKEYSKQGFALLDAFVYTSFMLPNDQEMSIRLGNQVISWGEALLSGGGLTTAINHVDAHIRNQPGLELKELFLPSNAILLQTSLTDSISIEAYYQFAWNPVTIDPSGSYFSEFDSLGDGGEQFMFITGQEEFLLGMDLTAHMNPSAAAGADRFDPNNWCDPNAPNTGQTGLGNCSDEDAVTMLSLQQFLPTNCVNEGYYNYQTNVYDASNANGKAAGSNPNATCRTLVSHKVEDNGAKNSGQYGLATTFFMDSGDEFGVYLVNYHEKIPSFILPIDAIQLMAPVIDLLVNTADPTNPVDFQGINDLGANLSYKQINALLMFMSVLPEKDGTIGSITNDLVQNPEKLGAPNLAESLFPTGGPTEGNQKIFNAALAAGSWAAVDVFMAPMGFSTATKVRNINYRIKYFEDVQMLGFTYSTIMGTANVATEFTWRHGTPLMGGDVARTPRESDLLNWHINTLMVFEPVELFGIQLWDFASFTAEALTWYALNRKPYDASDPDNSKRLAVQNTPAGLGLSAYMGLDYFNVFSGWDISVPLYVNWGARGAQFNAGYRNGQVTFATGMAFKHLSGVEIGTGVSFFFGDEDDVFQMLTSDRDNAQIYVKYSF